MSDPRLPGLLQVIQRFIQVPRTRVKPGGFPEDIFLNLAPDWQERLQCSICCLVLKDPRQCRNGHKYCWCCIHVWSVSGYSPNYSTCPVCRVEGDYYTASKVEDDEILNFQVKCYLKGCKWTGILRKQRSHDHEFEVTDNREHKAVPVELPPLTPPTRPRTITSVPPRQHQGTPNSLDPQLVSNTSPTFATLPNITVPPGVRPNPAYARHRLAQPSERTPPPSGAELDRQLSRTLGQVSTAYANVMQVRDYMQESRDRLRDLFSALREELLQLEQVHTQMDASSETTLVSASGESGNTPASDSSEGSR